MSRCRKNDSMMVEALYGELSPRRQGAFEAHLETCPRCAEQYEQLRQTQKIMDSHDPQVVDSAYWEGYWQRLAAQLPSPEAPHRRRDIRSLIPAFPAPLRPAWVPVAAAVMLVVTGIFIGRSLYFNSPSIGSRQAAILDPAMVTEFNTLANRYLDRTKTLLLGLDNFDTRSDDREVLNFAQQQNISHDLLFQGRELRNHQLAATDPRLLELVNEIEKLLLLLANSEDRDFVWTIDLIQEGLDERSILLEISLHKSGEIDEPETGEAKSPPPAKTSSILI